MAISRSLRRVLVLTIATISLLPLAAPAQAAITRYERTATGHINASRASSGVARLRVADGLAWLARQHSCAMARSQMLRHRPRITAGIARFRVLGENVGVAPDLDAVHRAFMASSGHRRNILGPRYREVGVGVCRDRYGSYWITHIFRG